MNKFTGFALVSLLVSAPTFASYELKTPRSLIAPIKLSNVKALDAYLVSLVAEYEGVKANDKDLEVYSSASEDCRLTANSMLACEVRYLMDRWNGEAKLVFAVKAGKVVGLTQAQFDGNY